MGHLVKVTVARLVPKPSLRPVVPPVRLAASSPPLITGRSSRFPASRARRHTSRHASRSSSRPRSPRRSLSYARTVVSTHPTTREWSNATASAPTPVKSAGGRRPRFKTRFCFVLLAASPRVGPIAVVIEAVRPVVTSKSPLSGSRRHRTYPSSPRDDPPQLRVYRHGVGASPPPPLLQGAERRRGARAAHVHGAPRRAERERVAVRGDAPRRGGRRDEVRGDHRASGRPSRVGLLRKRAGFDHFRKGPRARPRRRGLPNCRARPSGARRRRRTRRARRAVGPPPPHATPCCGASPNRRIAAPHHASHYAPPAVMPRCAPSPRAEPWSSRVEELRVQQAGVGEESRWRRRRGPSGSPTHADSRRSRRRAPGMTGRARVPGAHLAAASPLKSVVGAPPSAASPRSGGSTSPRPRGPPRPSTRSHARSETRAENASVWRRFAF